MKIRSLQLDEVRQFRRLRLDLASPVTVVGGPNGAGKTTVQKAILASLFEVAKDQREFFRSRFAPDADPGARLALELGAGRPEARLSRSLLASDKGEWRQGEETLKKKGAALAKVKEILSFDRKGADAPALLLCGLQEDLTKVVDAFPEQGQSLLTNSLVRGAGPDPRALIGDLQDEIADAAKGGRTPGPLTRAQNDLGACSRALEEAREALRAREAQEADLAKARREHEESVRRLAELEDRIKAREAEENALDALLPAVKKVEDLEKEIRTLKGAQADIEKKRKKAADLELEEADLEAQHRLARDRELREELDSLRERIAAAESAQAEKANAERSLQAGDLPTAKELEKAERLQTRAEAKDAEILATGVKYEIESTAGEKAVRVQEDGAAAREVTVSLANPLGNTVGTLVVEADGLRVSARGKRDLSDLKRDLAAARGDLQQLLRRFGCADVLDLGRLRARGGQIEKALDLAGVQLGKALSGETLAGLKNRLDQRDRDLRALGVGDAQRAEAAARLVLSSAELRNRLAGKKGELDAARAALKEAADGQAGPEAAQALERELQEAMDGRRRARERFEETSLKGRKPDGDLWEETRKVLKDLRRKRDDLLEAMGTESKRITEMKTLLGQGGAPQVPRLEQRLAELEAERDREKVRQEARKCLKAALEAKILELTASVPESLKDRIGALLRDMTAGDLTGLSLTSEFAVKDVQESGLDGPWVTAAVSHGQRAMTALCVKIAIAQTLAESSGSSFLLLDDSLVNLDPRHRRSAEDLFLRLAREGAIQVVFFTCATDWGADWAARNPGVVRYVDLPAEADYFHRPAGVPEKKGDA